MRLPAFHEMNVRAAGLASLLPEEILPFEHSMRRHRQGTVVGLAGRMTRSIDGCEASRRSFLYGHRSPFGIQVAHCTRNHSNCPRFGPL
jgi:hypothetical protein